ncbi:SRPBCC family protein [Kitasatospora sp. GAS1066B]|uniref:SRPBCC family protein n=1 Tax=Kitasatospora sp. GAS1066B TaxID=3156271 RepID=UPI003514C523
MSPITVSTDVDRPAEDVFAYAIDPTRFHEWQAGVIDGHIDQPGTPAVGARCRTTRRIGGANRPSTSEVVHVNPPETWGVRGIDGPVRAIVDVTVKPLTADRSRLTIAVDFEGHGIGKLLVPLVVRREARKEMPTNLATLKQRLERGQGDTSI